MQIKEEESLQISTVAQFELARNCGVRLANGNCYRLLQQHAQLISNRNESGKSGYAGAKAGRHYNNMGRVKGELDLTVLYSQGDTPTLAYIELKTPKRYAETGYYTKAYKNFKKGDKKSSVNIYNLEDSQAEFIDTVCKPLSIPHLVACNEIMVFDFLVSLEVVGKL